MRGDQVSAAQAWLNATDQSSHKDTSLQASKIKCNYFHGKPDWISSCSMRDCQ